MKKYLKLLVLLTFIVVASYVDLSAKMEEKGINNLDYLSQNK